ncbi:hypothetical protein [Clavibacter sp. Sh2088]|uniref:hypothetical protein n=1 Tax=Clavibacter sp. Sh2088 TaxID=3397676 RepID=UPI0039DFA6EC
MTVIVKLGRLRDVTSADTPLPARSYQSVDALQNALAQTVFSETQAPKKAAGRALGTLVELITFYMIRQWGLEPNVAIERGLPEYGNSLITHNVEFTLHPGVRVAELAPPASGRTLTPRQISIGLTDAGHASVLTGAHLRSGMNLLRNGVLRHALTVADLPGGFVTAYMTGDGDRYNVSRLIEDPFAMFECKRVGIEEGQRKGPQTIEKAKQGAYVARSVSGLQRIPRKDGSVAALVEAADGTLQTHPDYYQFLRDAIDSRDAQALANVVLTVGVVSNHGNWFTAETQNKEMRVLAQSYDWLLFLTDNALAEFIESVLQGTSPDFAATRAAFGATHGRSSGTTTFTKVTIDADADSELTKFFEDQSPWDRWFNVISPIAPIVDLKSDLLKLAEIRGGFTV